MKKLLVVLLCMVMTLSMLIGLVACVGTADVKIGVILYNYTDIQGKEIKNYCDNYLAKNFSVKFEYQTAAAGNDEAHLAAVDSLISMGVDAIMSGYDTVIGESMDKCASAGVYYGLLLGEAKNESAQDDKYNEWGNWGSETQSNLFHSEYFLGGILQFGADNGIALGKIYGNAVAAVSGVTDIGAISFPSYAFSDGVLITQGFVEAVSSALPSATLCNVDIPIYPGGPTVPGLPYEAGFVTVDVDTKTYIADFPQMNVLFGLSSGMDMVLPAVNEVGRLWKPTNTGDGKIKMATLGYNDSSRQYLSDGTLIIGGTNNYVQSVAYMFAMMFDAANGNNWKTSTDFQINAVINYPTFKNIAELDDMEAYMLTTVHNDFTKASVTASELKAVMKTFEGSGSWQSLQTLVSRTVAQIKTARA